MIQLSTDASSPGQGGRTRAEHHHSATLDVGKGVDIAVDRDRDRAVRGVARPLL
jgi:hypothetical protein